MKSPILLLSLILLLVVSCEEKESDWTPLLDQELRNWDSYLSYRFTPDYDGSVPLDENGDSIPPIGLNKDDFGVFTMIEENGEPILRVSGEIYGCVSTKSEYENYHLRLQVKWGDTKYPPRENKLKDSGILYHSIGPHGVEHWRSWMLSQEFQIMQGHFGDFWKQANSAIDVRAYPPESVMSAIADHKQPFIAIGKGEEIPFYCMRSNNYERPEGEWNTLELICFENKSIHIVNGEVAMVLQNSRYLSNGQKIPLNKGKIQLQSEACELFYKGIEIKELSALPVKYEAYY